MVGNNFSPSCILNLMEIQHRILNAIRTINDFPKPGISFKDITPVFLDPLLCSDIVTETIQRLPAKPDAICAIESRGFFFGMLLANRLQIPLFPVRKAGKLPGKVKQFSYTLEYGQSTLEIQENVVVNNWNVLVADDLLATGGTAVAAAELIRMEGGNVLAFSFLVALESLKGEEKLLPYSPHIVKMISL